MSNKVLVVDDSLTARKIVVDCLNEHGYSVIEANDGKQGLEQLKAHDDILLIFSDINMPWMTGLEMVEEIKKNDKWKEIPICLLTTESSTDALSSAKKLGVDAFLVKPIQNEQLTAVLDGYIKNAS